MLEGLRSITGSKSKTFLAFCFCFIAGTGIASLFDWSYGLAMYLYLSLFISLFFIIIFWHRRFTRFLLLNFLFLLLGIWRFALTIPDCASDAVLCHYNGHKLVMNGWVSAEPDVREDGAKYTVSVVGVSGQVSANSPSPSLGKGGEIAPPLTKKGLGGVAEVGGKLLITTLRYPQYQYGDTLRISCRIELPKNADEGTFRYDKYLARYGIWSVCQNPSVTLEQGAATLHRPPLVREGKRALMTRIFAFKTIVQNQMNRLWPEPDASFMAGILFGSKSGLPAEVSDAFNKTGVTHIIAVSGFNVTIIVTWLSAVLIFFGLRRQHAFWVIVGFIIVFVLFTGATASVVRAGVMGIITLVAVQMGRSSRVTIVLVVSAAVMLLGNPYLLVWDAGFQLSFLATIGLVYVSPVLTNVILRPQPKDPSELNERDSSVVARLLQNDSWTSGLFETFLQTLSAIIATLPLILYQFGRLSIVAPLVNVLVLWIIAWLMLGGFVSITASFIFFPLGQLVAYMTDLGLKYVLFVVEFFGRQRWAAISFQLPLVGMIFLYCVLLLFIKREKLKIKD